MKTIRGSDRECAVCGKKDFVPYATTTTGEHLCRRKCWNEFLEKPMGHLSVSDDNVPPGTHPLRSGDVCRSKDSLFRELHTKLP